MPVATVSWEKGLSRAGRVISTAIAGMSTTPLGVDISSATSSIRCSVRRASIDVMSALQEEHVHSTMHAASSSSTPLSSSVRVCAEDIALVHHSQGQQPQSLSHRDRAALTSTKQYDASALSTTVTLFGPGAWSTSLGATSIQGYLWRDFTRDVIGVCGACWMMRAATQVCLSEALPSCYRSIST